MMVSTHFIFLSNLRQPLSFLIIAVNRRAIDSFKDEVAAKNVIELNSTMSQEKTLPLPVPDDTQENNVPMPALNDTQEKNMPVMPALSHAENNTPLMPVTNDIENNMPVMPVLNDAENNVEIR